jgi:hypothetical protein
MESCIPSEKIDVMKAELMLLEGNIVKMTIKDEVHLEANDIREITSAIQKLVNGTNHTVLLLAGKYTSISKEATELSANEEISKNRFAKAIVTTSLAQRLMWNFLINLNASSRPIKLFKEENAAIAWLSGFTT